MKRFIVIKKVSSTNKMIKISIIIATYRRQRQLIRCLDSIDTAVEFWDTVEVIVVDDGGGMSGACRAGFSHLPIKWIELEKNLGQPGAQSVGVSQARGEILAFLDDDAVIDKNWITAIKNYFENNPGIHVVVGRIKPLSRDHILARTRQQIYDHRHRKYSDPDFRKKLTGKYQLDIAGDTCLSDHISGGNFAVRAITFKSTVDFNPNIRLGSDDLMSEKLLSSGQAIGYCRDMVIYHEHNTRYRTLFRNNFIEGRDRVRGLICKGKFTRGKTGAAVLLNLFCVPVRIFKFREILKADRNKRKVYIIYTLVQFFDALGRLYQYILSFFKFNEKLLRGD